MGAEGRASGHVDAHALIGAAAVLAKSLGEVVGEAHVHLVGGGVDW